MREFKPGDRVRRKRDASAGMEIGDELVVKRFYLDGDGDPWLEFDQPLGTGWDPACYELVESAGNLKPGDRVRHDKYGDGTIASIVAVNGIAMVSYGTITQGHVQAVALSLLTKVELKPKTLREVIEDAVTAGEWVCRRDCGCAEDATNELASVIRFHFDSKREEIEHLLTISEGEFSVWARTERIKEILFGDES